MQAIQGDITAMQTDAIVNAANSTLLGGGGVDGAIHRAAGPELVAACRPLAPCPTGQARITPGFRLAARWVIHTVGPVWHGGNNGEADALTSCYRNSLHLCPPHGIRSIAFPAISTGVYRFPKREAASIAIQSCRAFLAKYEQALEIVFVCFDREQLAIYEGLLAGI